MLHPIRLKHTTVTTPLFMAPVAGVCNIPFRAIATQCGCPNIFTEMVSSEALIRNSQKTRDFLKVGRHETVQPFIQLFGAKPAVMAEAARICADEGFRLIDVNMGCPVRKVLRSGSGVELMQHPELAAEIVHCMVQAAGSVADITVKTRLGIVHGDNLLHSLAPLVQAAGASMLTVHARTRSDGFGSQARWHQVSSIRPLLQIPLIINGDIIDTDSARTAMEQSQAQGAMIAREGYARPWIFARILCELQGQPFQEPLLDEVRAIMLRHLELLCHYIPDRAHVLMRKHGSWYTRGLPGGSEFRQQLNHCPDSRAVARLIHEHFA